MRIRTLMAGFVMGIGATVLTNAAISQDGGMKQPSPEEMQQMMEEWTKAMMPGPEHEALMHSCGSWNTTTRMWMAGPDQPPTEVKGTAERVSVLGGRFVHETMKSQMMMPDETGAMKPVPWEGSGLFGYDNYRKMHIGCWADTMGTQLLTMKGAMSPDGKVLTMYGEMDEPMLGIIGRTVKYQTTMESNDRAVFRIYDLHAGDNYKVVEVVYERAKKN